MKQNLITATLADADRDAVLAAIATIKEKLPFLLDLSLDQRRYLVKMGDGNKPFVDKCQSALNQNADILPPAFGLAEFNSDYALYAALQPVVVQITQLAELLDDTLMAVGSDLYNASLEGYTYLKAAGQGQSLDELRKDMATRFKQRGSGSTTTTSASTPAK